jgi:hypothetical protein
VLELRAAFVGRLGYGEETCDCRRRVLCRADGNCFLVPHDATILRPLGSGTQLDGEVAFQRIRDAQECVDPRRTPAALEARDRGLGRPDELGELSLRQTALLPALGDVLRDRREEPTPVGRADPFLKTLERAFLPGHYASSFL